MERMAAQKTVDVAGLAASKRFGRYRPESGKAVRKAEVKESESLRQMISFWGSFSSFVMDGPFDHWQYEQNFKHLLCMLGDIRFVSGDIEEMSLALGAFQETKHFRGNAGVFLSGLVAKGKDTEYIIHTGHAEMDCIGYRNGYGRSIIVEGDVREYAGLRMEGGNLTIKGNALHGLGGSMSGGCIEVSGSGGSNIGYLMRDGSIIVHGDATQSLGFMMRGGRITINGNAGADVGKSMKRGEIWLNGDFKSLADEIEGGRIYHKGKLIVDK